MNNNYVLLYFEHENDITIIIKLHRATHLWLAALFTFYGIFDGLVEYTINFHVVDAHRVATVMI